MRSKWLALACASPLVVCSVYSGQPKSQLLQQLPGRQVQPSRAAPYTVVDGRMVLTGDWVQLGGPATRDIFTCAWDAIELDLTGGILGAPTDNLPGCTGFLPAGNRWFFGATYSNPFVSADINGAVPGAACEGLGQAWYIDVGDAEPDNDGDGLPDSPLFIAVQQFENMDVVNCTDDGSGFIDGVIYDFSGNAWDPAFYNYTTITLNGSGLFHTMPADGNGGYQLIYGIAFDPVTGIITVPNPIDPVTLTGVNVQSMLWGSHNNEPADDGRCGEDVDGQFDDDAPVNGQHSLSLECYSYLYGVCPDPLAASTGFYFKGVTDPCPCPGDLNGDNTVDIADLALFLSSFGSSGGGCADLNGDGIIDIADLALFLSSFGSTCVSVRECVGGECDQFNYCHWIVSAPVQAPGVCLGANLGLDYNFCLAPCPQLGAPECLPANTQRTFRLVGTNCKFKAISLGDSCTACTLGPNGAAGQTTVTRFLLVP